jgi:hypothetical protein
MPRTIGGLIAARTRTAQHILALADLLALYEAKGGLRRDLEAIRDAGLKAEAHSLAQSVAKGEGSGASLHALEAFAALQREYNEVMAVVQAVRGDLAKAGAGVELIAAIDRILVNEAQVVIRAVEKEGGGTERHAVRSASQEALRAEIAKDAGALLGLGGVKAALGERKVSAARLLKVKSDAEALSGKLATRATKKGEKQAATEAKSEAAREQSARWSACYRLLGLMAQQNQGVAELLKEAARPRAKKKA